MFHGIGLTSSGHTANKMDSLCDRFPLHRAVFEGNLRKVSGCLRTCDITEKDVHGKNYPICGDRVLKAPDSLFSFPPITGRHKFI